MRQDRPDTGTERVTPILGLAALRPYLSLLRGQTRDIVFALVLMGISTAVSLTIPLYAGKLVDRLRVAATEGFPAPLVTLLGGLLVLQLLGSFFFSVVSQRLGLRTVTRLRQRVFAHLVELPSLFFTQQQPGDLSSRLTSDVGAIRHLLTSGSITLIRAVATLVGAVILMFGLSRRLTVVVLLTVPATILLAQLFGRRLQRLSRQMYDELGQVSNHVQQVAGAIRVVKVFNNQSGERRRFQAMLTRYLEAGLRRAWLSAALESSIQILLWICLIAVVIYGFYLSGRGETTYGELVAFLLLVFRVAMPLGSLANLYASTQGAVAAAGRLDTILAAPAEGQEPLGPDAQRRRSLESTPARVAPPAPEPQGAAAAAATSGVRSDAGQPPRGAAVIFEGVSFAYHREREPVLSELNLTIPAGARVGIVGPSGAGKTTLTALLLRLFDPDRGRLLLDTTPYRELDLHELRAQMAYVAQEPVLYDDSIEVNIRFGNEAAAIEEIREAARRAHALEFIDRLPEGLATRVGDRGIRLSGGERQRIALARAFLRDPRLIVLDEPTSALDAAAEESVQRALRQLLAGRTAVVIAHRLSLVRDLDLILVLAEGRIVEQGCHGELLAKQGFYAQLHRLQQGQTAISP